MIHLPLLPCGTALVMWTALLPTIPAAAAGPHSSHRICDLTVGRLGTAPDLLTAQAHAAARHDHGPGR